VRILILGPQGSGKGTQAKRIADAYDVPHVATGDILRAAVADGSELGAQVRPILERGDLVPDDLMVGLIRERLVDEDGFVLDGFPRTVNQAEALDRRLAEQGTPLEAALSFDVTEDELLRRLAGRAAAQHRADDAEQTIRHRLEVFAIKTRPLIDYYRHRRLLTMVDGVGRVEDVTTRILDGLPASDGGRDPALALAV
jgi:adenylate kinase